MVLWKEISDLIFIKEKENIGKDISDLIFNMKIDFKFDFLYENRFQIFYMKI